MATGRPTPPTEAHALQTLLGYVAHGISGRAVAKTGGGNATLFTFEKSQALSEHTSPFHALG